MNFYCYILYSKKINRYYIGETEDIEKRLMFHNTGKFKGSYTSQAIDWELKLRIRCESRSQARLIESHIKRMKSRKYIENLFLYPKIIEKLKNKYNAI